MKHLHSQSAQALAETALAIPLLILLLMGVWDSSSLINAQNSATKASRDAARLIAALGNGSGVAPVDPDSIDTQGTDAVAGVMQSLPASQVQLVQVDVYQANGGTTDSWSNPAQDSSLGECYVLSGGVWGRAGSCPLSTGDFLLAGRQRGSTLPYVGVKVLYDFKSPAPVLGVLFDRTNMSAFSVFQEPPLD